MIHYAITKGSHSILTMYPFESLIENDVPFKKLSSNKDLFSLMLINNVSKLAKYITQTRK